MSKKIIAVLLAVTVVFMCVFAACNKNKEEKEEQETKVYGDVTEYPFVTDENGDRVYTDDGEFVVYVTNESGDVVTDANGEGQTIVQQFVPIIEDNVAEFYGYSIELPEGWSASSTRSGTFVNEKKGQKVTITALEKTYDDYYDANKQTYEAFKGETKATVTWEEDVTLGEGCSKVVRFGLKTDEGMNVMYFFVNNNNLYKILFESADPNTAVADSEAICAAVSYKPYQYFEIDVTGAVEESVVESIPSTTEAITQ